VEASQRRLETFNQRGDAPENSKQMHHNVSSEAPTDVVMLPQRRLVP